MLKKMIIYTVALLASTPLCASPTKFNITNHTDEKHFIMIVRTYIALGKESNAEDGSPKEVKATRQYTLQPHEMIEIPNRYQERLYISIWKRDNKVIMDRLRFQQDINLFQEDVKS